MKEKSLKIIEIIKKIKPQLIEINENTILNSGILDSLDIVNLIVQLEITYDTKINFNYINKENFENIKTILAMIEKVMEREIDDESKK